MADSKRRRLFGPDLSPAGMAVNPTGPDRAFQTHRTSVDGPWARYVDCGGKRSATPLSSGPASQSAVAADALPAHSKIGLARYPRLVPKDADCAAQLKKRTLTNLYNERPAWLDLAHRKLDAAVAAAYGWPADLTDEQILEKLLALNLARAAEEAKASKVKKPKATREKRADELI